MNYISVKDAASKWCVSVRQVQHLCLENKVIGAINLGKQWLIPENTDRPADGRTKTSKQDSSIDSYHFPILVHSRFYSTNIGLSKEEKQILQSQIYNVTGEYDKSINFSREAILQSNKRHVQFAGFITLAYDYMLLGNYEKFKSCIVKINSLLKKEIAHKEDFLLVYNGLMLHIGWNRNGLMNINQLNISSDAIIYFQSMIIESSFINNEKVNLSTLKLYETLSRDLLTNGMIPTLLMSHCLLSSLYYKNKNYEMSEYHAKEACDISIKHNLINYLSKYYLAMKKDVDKILGKMNKPALDYLKNSNNHNLKNLILVSKKELDKKFKFPKPNNSLFNSKHKK